MLAQAVLEEAAAASPADRTTLQTTNMGQCCGKTHNCRFFLQSSGVFFFLYTVNQLIKSSSQYLCTVGEIINIKEEQQVVLTLDLGKSDICFDQKC